MPQGRWINYFTQFFFLRVYRGPFLLAAVVLIFLQGSLGWTSVIAVTFAWLADFGLYFGLLNLACARQKNSALTFMKERAPRGVWERTPMSTILGLVHISRLPPFGYFPEKLRPRALDVHYYMLVSPKGAARKRNFGSPSAFPSPAGTESFIFLRDKLEDLDVFGRFKVLHEIGHTSSIGAVCLKREAVAGAHIWIFALAAGPLLMFENWLLLFFWLVIVAIAALSASIEYRRVKIDLGQQAEIGADMFAADSIPPEDAAYLLSPRGQYLLQPPKPDAQTEARAILLRRFLRTRASGERLPVGEYQTRLKDVTNLGINHVVACAVVVAVACFVGATYWEHIWWSIVTGVVSILFYIVTKLFETAVLHNIFIYIDAGHSINAPTAT